MGFTTAIPWCHHTFNLWWGCVEVSPACDDCYARIMAGRFGHHVWGKDAPRRFFGDAYWRQLEMWNAQHAAAGTRGRVFVMSMGDWGEERDGDVGAEMANCRSRLWAMIPVLTSLDFLMLTKRPQAYRRLMPASIRALPNVWCGVTVESPTYLWRVDELLATDGIGGPHWVSHEPALACTDFARHLPADTIGGVEFERWLHWIVVGCESRGGRAGRNADGYETCAVGVIEQGQRAGVAVYHKQMPIAGRVSHDPAEWRPALRVREFPRGGA